MVVVVVVVVVAAVADVALPCLTSATIFNNNNEVAPSHACKIGRSDSTENRYRMPGSGQDF